MAAAEGASCAPPRTWPAMARDAEPTRNRAVAAAAAARRRKRGRGAAAEEEAGRVVAATRIPNFPFVAVSLLGLAVSLLRAGGFSLLCFATNGDDGLAVEEASRSRKRERVESGGGTRGGEACRLRGVDSDGGAWGPPPVLGPELDLRPTCGPHVLGLTVAHI